MVLTQWVISGTIQLVLSMTLLVLCGMQVYASHRLEKEKKGGMRSKKGFKYLVHRANLASSSVVLLFAFDSSGAFGMYMWAVRAVFVDLIEATLTITGVYLISRLLEASFKTHGLGVPRWLKQIEMAAKGFCATGHLLNTVVVIATDLSVGNLCRGFTNLLVILVYGAVALKLVWRLMMDLENFIEKFLEKDVKQNFPGVTFTQSGHSLTARPSASRRSKGNRHGGNSPRPSVDANRPSVAPGLRASVTPGLTGFAATTQEPDKRGTIGRHSLQGRHHHRVNHLRGQIQKYHRVQRKLKTTFWIWTSLIVILSIGTLVTMARSGEGTTLSKRDEGLKRRFDLYTAIQPIGYLVCVYAFMYYVWVPIFATKQLQGDSHSSRHKSKTKGSELHRMEAGATAHRTDRKRRPARRRQVESSVEDSRHQQSYTTFNPISNTGTMVSRQQFYGTSEFKTGRGLRDSPTSIQMTTRKPTPESDGSDRSLDSRHSTSENSQGHRPAGAGHGRRNKPNHNFSVSMQFRAAGIRPSIVFRDQMMMVGGTFKGSDVDIATGHIEVKLKEIDALDPKRSFTEIMATQRRVAPHLKVPIVLIELLKSIEFLGGLKTRGLFRVPGDKSAVLDLRRHFRSGKRGCPPATDVHTVATLLKEFLKEKSSPLFPSNRYGSCVALAQRAKNGKPVDNVQIQSQILKIPAANAGVLQYLAQFFKIVTNPENIEIIGMSLKNLALAFSPAVIRNTQSKGTAVVKNLNLEIKFTYMVFKCIMEQYAGPGITGRSFSEMDRRTEYTKEDYEKLFDGTVEEGMELHLERDEELMVPKVMDFLLDSIVKTGGMR